jgi:hypothetical protein
VIEMSASFADTMMIGLSSWIIADGNYEHFKCGDRASFALGFYPANSPLEIPRDWLSVNPPGVDRASIRHVEGSDYIVTAKVTQVLDYEGWWVIDAGILMYRAGMPPDDVKPGCWVSGKIYVGIDPFDYFERLSRHHAAPALIYDWDITKIDLETTPLIEEGRLRWRDQSRRGWREVNDTKARAGGMVDEFVLHCVRADSPPRR